MASRNEVGKIRIVNGDQEAYILPESLAAWEHKGWSYEQAKDANAEVPTKTVETTDGQEVTVTSAE